MPIELSAVLLGLTLVLRFCPETELARWLSKHVVERPLAWASRLERHDLIYFVILPVVILGAGEVVVALGSADLLFVYAADVAFYLDAMIATSLLAAMARARAAAQSVRACASTCRRQLASLLGRAGHSRAPRRPTAKRPVNDDDDQLLFLLAA